MSLKKIFKKFSQTHWLFVIIALVFGVVFVYMTPPLWGPDETVHFVRTYQISRGNVLEKPVDVGGSMSYGGGIPNSLISLNNLKTADINDGKPGDTRQVDSTAAYSKVGGVSLSKDREVASPFGEIIYPAFTYMAPATGVLIASLFHPTVLHLLYVARLATLVFYIILVFISLYVLRKSSFRWVIFVIALLPSTLYQASVVSADSLVTSLCLLLFSIIYCISHTEKYVSRKSVLIIVIATAMIALIKLPYVLFVLILPFLYISKNVSSKMRLLIRIGIPVIGALIAARVVFGMGSSSAVLPPGINTSDQLHWILSHPAGYLYMILNSFLYIDWMPQIMGVFGTSFIFIPMPLVYVLVSLLVLTAFIKLDSDTNTEKNDKKIQAFAYLGVSIASVTAVITSLFLAFTTIGAEFVRGVQGRYFIPILPFFLYGIRILIRSRFKVAEKSARIAYPLIMTLCLTISILWYYKVLY